jgi:arsenate reductase (thioredoxin)
MPNSAGSMPGRGDGQRRVMFVCTHNSARSIMAEVLLRKKGGLAYEVVSAGTQPGEVRPLTLRVLEEAGLPTAGLRSKSVSEFMGQTFDYVITVCDSARQDCPVFPGEGERLHWGYDDPSAAAGSEEERLGVFRSVFTAISQRIDLFLTVERTRDTADSAGGLPSRL